MAPDERRPSPAQLETFWSLSLDLLAIADFDGRFLQVNDRWTDLLGWTRDDLVSKPYLDFVHPEDLERTRAQAERMAEGIHAVAFENRYRASDGTYRWLLWNARSVPEEFRIHAIARDVTEAKKAERILRLYQEVAAASNEADDLDTALKSALASVCDATDFPVGHAYRVAPDTGDPSPTTLWHVRDPVHFAAFQDLEQRTAFQGVTDLPRQVCESGEPAWITDLTAPADVLGRFADDPRIRRALAFPVLSGPKVAAVLEFFDGHPLEPDRDFLLVMAHVGHQLGRVIDRDAALGAERHALDIERRFLSMAVHELRTPLQVVLGYSQILDQHWDDLGEERIRNAVQQMEWGAKQARHLVDDFLDLVRLRQSGFQADLEELPLREHLRGSIEGLGSVVGDVEMSVPELTVRADPGFLGDIVVNLLTNAGKYGSPPISIEAAAKGDTASIRFCDAGEGVPEEFVGQLFADFARARTEVEGSGLGLAIARELARAQGGDLVYDADGAAGACFVLQLPLVRTPARA